MDKMNHNEIGSCQSVFSASAKNEVSLLDLSSDSLQAISFWLRPKDRFSLATACRRLYAETWGALAEEDITNRFPFERRMEFNLCVKYDPKRHDDEALGSDITDSQMEACHLPAKSKESLRIVPERSRMQHCFVSVSINGDRVAVLTYDNIMRVLCTRSKAILCELDVGYTCGVDVWDNFRGKRVPYKERLSPRHAYEEENGVDVEIGFGFSYDSEYLFLSNKSRLRIFRSTPDGVVISASLALQKVRPLINENEAVGGSCAMSPNNNTVAWAVFAGRPARVFLTVWDVERERCVGMAELAKIQPRRWSALGWGRVQYTPNGRYIICIVNNAKKSMQTVRVGEGFQTMKLSEYQLSIFPCPTNSDASSASSRVSEVCRMQPLRSRVVWLDLSPDVYPQQLAGVMSRLLEGIDIQDCSGSESRSTTYMKNLQSRSRAQEMRLPRLHLNALHSCPSEATYKALSFGPYTRHPWFVTKQPMYNVHMSANGDHMLVTASPHANGITSLIRDDTSSDDRQRMRAVDSSCEQGVQANRGDSRRESRKVDISEHGIHMHVARRKHAFYGMPWRAGFATTSGFSSTGKWLASATLMDDKCVVCVRNITIREYFG